jgi:hypothetical protein
MIETPTRWPYWPILPLKRPGNGWPDTGYCITPDYPTVVLKKFLNTKGILLQLACEEDGLPVPGQPGKVQGVPDEMRAMYEKDIVEKRYQDIDGMLDDGWRVD